MKTKLVILAALLIGCTLNFSCHKQAEEADTLKGDDLVAFKGMQTAYSNAKLYNDSLMSCTDSLQQIHCDNTYHNYYEQFDLHHNNYSHSNSFDDHHHDGGGGMQQQDGNGTNHGNCACCGSDSDSESGHYEVDHTMMDKLNQQHQPYHPDSN